MANFGDLSPDNTIVGGTDSTTIGNESDMLLVYSKLNLEQMQMIRSLLYDLKEELQKMNVHLAHMTELEVEAGD